MASRAKRRRSALRTISWSGRRTASSTSRPSRSAAARLMPRIRWRASIASTPSIMLPSTASCCVPCRPMSRPRSSSCSRSVATALAIVASSRTSQAGRRTAGWPSASRAVAEATSRTGSTERRQKTYPAARAAAAQASCPPSSSLWERARSRSDSLVSRLARTRAVGASGGPCGTVTERNRRPVVTSNQLAASAPSPARGRRATASAGRSSAVPA